MTFAVPHYVARHLPEVRGIPPGHWFRLYFGGWWTRELEESRIGFLESELAKETKEAKRRNLERTIQKREQKLNEGADLGELDNEARQNFLFRVFPGLTRESISHSAELDLVGLPELAPCAVQDSAHLAVRQKVLAARAEALIQTVVTTAPFTTGLGIEHPLENGFAFLDPYGLPYLPGSSVKGVLRRAAEELALFETDSQGWSVPAIWWLFGFDSNSAFFVPDGEEPKPIIEERRRWREGLRSALERPAAAELDLLVAYLQCACAPQRGASVSPTERVCSWIPTGRRAVQEIREIHTRGALDLWDVIPEPKDGNLRVDIMNPHYGHYYQHGQPPGDWGSPVPIYFLTLPPGTTFTFIARFRPPLNWPEPVRHYFESAEDGAPRWKRLVEAAFHFAFDWLGFGAKTAVGYGRMASQWHAPRVEQPAARPPSGSSGSGHHEPRGVVKSQPGTPAPGRIGAPGEPGPAGGDLRDLERRIAAIATARDVKSEADVLSNELVRKRSHPDAPRLAAGLWMAIREKQWLADRLRRNPTFAELAKKGGAE